MGRNPTQSFVKDPIYSTIILYSNSTPPKKNSWQNASESQCCMALV